MRDDLNPHAARLAGVALRDLATPRAAAAPLSAAGWQVSVARHYLDAAAEAALLTSGAGTGLETAARRLFAGEIVNPSEGRPALHWALRAGAALSGEPETVRLSLQPALAFAGKIRAGEVRTAKGERFRAVLHIGIGGSDFGPRLIADAFGDLADPGIELRFAANVDPYDLDRAMAGLDPAATLVIGVSKSFGTEETLYNLNRARNWLEGALVQSASAHLALVTANPAKATAWLGGRSAHLFDMPLSVGGRFSLWSAASLACMISLGPDTFRDILAGAAEMDDHTRAAPLADNVPMRLALLDYWNASVRGAPMRVLLAYANRLRMLPTYLQQLEMESNGKSAGPSGQTVAPPTAPAIWGGEGSVGQHSYHQWLHQGSQVVPCEFILAADRGRDPEGLAALTSHALAQAEVLANGRSLAEVNAEEPDLPAGVAPQKVHSGGRPSTLLSHAAFGPKAFGALIALYEHRTYFAGHLWGVNPFDQWGVERGKTMAARLRPALTAPETAEDAVTAALLRMIR
ncbi:MAG: glucose-6-phosphate isomerase [Hyphomonas sp.]|uniref:glucose-6-phosphate isomerase n=1 Tax=Hyphomonas sp. TaxID=87 RepID=UPI0017F117FE|nr:glucose-6-phosphate isomerase [Hyphomonas sp.]MBA3070226.1 glucose-6-phosphate isomerase [Hyphomonas sp.]MBU4062722.1 glucose-6-phosphate isomerase [Alphaproteobacteria bacterium]MBU4163640.1 glucose-6-phosphate isomerase [Alphaproteobacteria bacterium]MBU4568888.1 glucose-6-phosphate isomerase [Alphaproteobacteria bacterium]